MSNNDEFHIVRFVEEHAFLSNFFESVVLLNGEEYPTVEHAFQAAKTLSVERRKLIQCCLTPAAAKKQGRVVPLRKDWEEIKLPVMRNLVSQKFRDAKLRDKLLATYPRRLLEGNTWNDTFWGVDLASLRGHNHLGNILHNVREDLRLEHRRLDQ